MSPFVVGCLRPIQARFRVTFAAAAVTVAALVWALVTSPDVQSPAGVPPAPHFQLFRRRPHDFRQCLPDLARLADSRSSPSGRGDH